VASGDDVRTGWRTHPASKSLEFSVVKAHLSLYAPRKQTPEPVFGIIKSVFGFRQFSLRGLAKVGGEWSLVTVAWNLNRMFTLAPV
jgi:hypothetical protein